MKLGGMPLDPNDPYGVLKKNNKISGIPPPLSPYGGFWRRLGALLLDMIIFSPLLAFTYAMNNHYRLFMVYYLPVGILIGLIYDVYLVKRFGGTLGKLILGLRITKVDGAAVGYKEALLRYAPGFILSLPVSVALVMALLQASDAEYAALSAGPRHKYIENLKPDWHIWFYIAWQVWIWGELLVLLTNKKKRALHDFIAGTVVLRNNATL